jgi:phosphoserine phosphatase
MTEPILAVDMDGTLVRSDLLHETFWAAFARDWRVPFRALAALMRGRAALKARLAELALPDAAALPYEDAVLDLIRDRRAAGGRVALVTAADKQAAQAVAAHLGLFDEVHASDGETNLKGPRKAEFLTRTYGETGFDYVGDTSADLPVWAGARTAYSAGAQADVRAALAAARARAGQSPPVHLAPAQSALPALIRALRPHQWA